MKNIYLLSARKLSMTISKFSRFLNKNLGSIAILLFPIGLKEDLCLRDHINIWNISVTT